MIESIKSRLNSPVLLIALTLILFNTFVGSGLWLDIRNAAEVGMIWTDEGIHVSSLERIQETGSIKLIHSAYTSLYPHLSFATSWLLSLGQMPIASETFILGSKLVSLIGMNVYALMLYGIGLLALGSHTWAWLLMLMGLGLRINMVFATHLHPEATMMAFIAINFFNALRFIERGQLRSLLFMAVATALAIGAKPQAAFLLPWNTAILLIAFYRHDLFSWRRCLSWIALASVVGGLFLFLATPYQLIHFSEWRAALGWQSDFALNSWASRSHWEWLHRIRSGKYLGDAFFWLFVLGLIFGLFHLFPRLTTLSRIKQLKMPDMTLAVALLWLIIGGAYPLYGSSFVHRYLIHIQIAFLLILLIGCYWALRRLKPSARRWAQVIGMLLILGGIHDHWHNTSRAMTFKKRIVSDLPHHRAYFEELQQLVPKEAKILYTPREVYMDPQIFPNAELCNEFSIPHQIKTNPDYLLVNVKFRPGLRYEGLNPQNENERSIIQTIAFWKALEHDGVNGAYTLLRSYPKVNVQLYEKAVK